MESECLPQALALGISYELFWSPGFCPRNVECFVKAHKIRMREEDEIQFHFANYVNEAVFNATYNAVGLQLRGKEFTPIDFRKKSYTESAKEAEHEAHLSEDEIRARTEQYFELLQLQAFNFNQAKREKEKENSESES